MCGEILKAFLLQKNLASLAFGRGYRSKIMMETQTVGLTFYNGQVVVTAFDQILENGDGIISGLRKDKFITELDMHRRARQPFR